MATEISNNVKDFKTLKVMDKIRPLVKEIYQITDQKFPSSEKFAMTDQIRRAATSIGANVTEGNGQMYPSKEISFISNALGSLAETRYWITTACDVGYITQAECDGLETRLLEILKMLHGCIRRLKEEERRHGSKEKD